MGSHTRSRRAPPEGDENGVELELGDDGAFAAAAAASSRLTTSMASRNKFRATSIAVHTSAVLGTLHSGLFDPQRPTHVCQSTEN